VLLLLLLGSFQVPAFRSGILLLLPLVLVLSSSASIHGIRGWMYLL